MHNIKFIMEFPEKFCEAMYKRGVNIDIEQLTQLYGSYKHQQSELQEMQSQKNKVAQLVSQAMASQDNTTHLHVQGEQIKIAIAESEKELLSLGEKLKTCLMDLPNLPDDDVPYGEGEEDNVELEKWGDIREFSFVPKQHFEIGEQLQQLNFEIASRMSGSRFYIATGSIAELIRAVAAMALDMHVRERGYMEVSTPLLVRDHAMFGSGQLPKFSSDSFTVNNGEYRLIPTSEVALVNTVAESILREEQLPLRLTAHTPCFRSEAGSAGKDTRGMMRLHQFYKVELVHICTQEQIKDEYEYMVRSAEMVLQKLQLPYRKMLLCSQDMSFSARKTYDLEVWLPGQGKYREVSSCSDCGEFQARRLNARFKCNKMRANKFLYTTNGSALAIERTVIAILENYQQHDGSVVIPEALRQYMGGKSIICIMNNNRLFYVRP